MPTTTNYIWDDENLLAEADGAGAINTVYTNEPKQYGNLISTRVSSAASFHHFDGIGSTRQLTNVATAKTDTMLYDAWGLIVARNGGTTVNCLWNGAFGYYFDNQLSSHYVRRRCYSGTIARWIAVDPLMFAGASFDSPHPFAYVHNQPLLRRDPSGLKDDDVAACDTCKDVKNNPTGRVEVLTDCINVKMSCNVVIDCLCCGNIGTNTSACTWITKDGVIHVGVCCESANIKNSLIHELLHAIGFCRRQAKEAGWDRNTCDDCLKEELMAYICEGRGGTTGELIANAMNSCSGIAGAPQKGAAPNPPAAGPYRTPCGRGGGELDPKAMPPKCNANELQAVDVDKWDKYIKLNYPDRERSTPCEGTLRLDKCPTLRPPPLK
jgi:RHS repeat-associated protein